MKRKAKYPWRRYRFKANPGDPRPVKFPPPGPYWVSGEGEDYAILIAYLPPTAKLNVYWPEASESEYTLETEITFTDRFPKPEWWEREKGSLSARLGDEVLQATDGL